ncbi:hypothetical protein QBC34DRAFT_53375 [Podospora aff. communis PSN243]|uniref:Uncharacterized protein n=1 Tax=Podospora aff. communis PSN243 TaxID=3040156 RepID=A0AAV9GVL4_9PEZI|nr:hypothetical protein QBC34DRAFT_53375 [Podospora aff. communis PSN243]
MLQTLRPSIPCESLPTYLILNRSQPAQCYCAIPALASAQRWDSKSTAGGWRQTRKTSLVCPTTRDTRSVVADGSCESFAPTPTTHITSASGQWKSSEQARGADGLHGDDRARRLKALRRCGGLAALTIQQPPPISTPLQKRLGRPRRGHEARCILDVQWAHAEQQRPSSPVPSLLDAFSSPWVLAQPIVQRRRTQTVHLPGDGTSSTALPVDPTWDCRDGPQMLLPLYLDRD